MKKYILYTLLPLAMAAGALLASCDADPVTFERGIQPSPDAPAMGMLKDSKTGLEQAMISLYAETGKGEIVFKLTKPHTSDVTATLSFGNEEDVTNWNDSKELVDDNRRTLFPAERVSLGKSVLSVAAGQDEAQTSITFDIVGMEAGFYLFPVKVQTEGVECAEQYKTLYYGLNIYDDEHYEELPLCEEWLTVFYVDCADRQPLVAHYYALQKSDANTMEVIYDAGLGNLVVLKTSLVDYEAATGRAIFAPTSDIKYIAEHAEKYIRPMQKRGRKVLLCISGGGTGLGPCNMNDEQIADFVEQVKTFVERYEFDGVNIWDKGSGYGMSGFAEVNTTSYPKLIKALDEAMPDKLITVCDYEEPTATFHDTAATGGIAVGEYLDYAWSGYVDEDAAVEYIDPWQNGARGRKPFAGLPQDKYGNWFFPNYTDNSEFLYGESGFEWQDALLFWNYYGASKSAILAFDNVTDRTVNHEGADANIQNVFVNLWMNDMYMPIYHPQYHFPTYAFREHNQLAKDWK